MQVDAVSKSEDCLTLDVWRPAEAEGPLPVMVFIHGGALVHGGAANYSGAALARQGVVYVGMNYRLGRLGFFAHPALAAERPRDVRGNYGYLDQRAALQWVQDNIDAFGGDPHNVTVFGEAAGAGSVLVHLTSPMSRGLFARAIVESPVLPTARASATPLVDLAKAESRAIELTHAAGILADDRTALERLRALPASRLVAGASNEEEIAAVSAGSHVPGFTGPILDGRFVVETPEAALAAGHVAPVSLLVGVDDREAPLGVAKTKDELFAHFGKREEAARALYDPDGEKSLDVLREEAFADAIVVEPARHLANEWVRTGQATFFYRFSYVAAPLRTSTLGAVHGSEVSYVFGSAQPDADSTAMSKLVRGYWISFAATGDPNGGDRPEWPRFSGYSIFDFTNDGPVATADPTSERLDLWHDIHQEAFVRRMAASSEPPRSEPRTNGLHEAQ
jgi:para-nitrobenzyl esterase